MNPKDFRLQYVGMRCEYPESPVFWEVGSALVKSHLPKYTDWMRSSGGFGLKDEGNKTIVYLFSEYIHAAVESLSDVETKLKNFSDNTLALIRDALREFGYTSVKDADYRYRFFWQAESLEKPVSLLIHNFANIPEEYERKFKATAIDYDWGVTFPYKDFQCHLWIYVVSRKDIKEIFPMSADECGQAGLVITVNFFFPPDRETISLPELERFFATRPQEFFDIAAMVAKSIKK